jgi:hypothetical protein
MPTPRDFSEPITGVAIKFAGKVWSLPAPLRHHHVIRLIAESNGKGIDGPDVQGFIDASGAFLTRKQAFLRAYRTGQLKPRQPGQYNGNELYSEDLW